MHAEARAFAEEILLQYRPETVLEFGSLNINGGVRDILPDSDWFGIDIQSGPGVDKKADARIYRHPFRVAMVVCCEVLEHAPGVRGIVSNARANLHIGGALLITCATNPRAPHSAVDGGALRTGEHYANIESEALALICEQSSLRVVGCRVDGLRGDLYMLAERDR